MFTASSSPSSRLPSHPVEHPLSGPSTAPDISSNQKTSLQYYGANGVRDLNPPRLSVPASVTIPPRSPRPNGPLPHHPAHFLTSPHHVSIDPTNPRPRTPPVPAPQQNLTSHHGLPSSLPPPPRTTYYTPQEPPSQPFPSNQDSEISNIASYLDTILRGSYSKMLSQKQERPDVDSAPAEPQVPTAPVELTLDDMFKADYLDPTTYEEFLTSPLLQDDTPEETPFLETPGEDAWTSPIIDPGDDSYGMGTMPLFGAVTKPADDKPPTPVHESLDVLRLFLSSPGPTQDKIDAVTPSLVPLDIVTPPLYTMPSTPALVPTTLFNPNSSSNTSHSSSSVPARPTKPLPTGTRRNITPASLVPLDAPTQARQYATPSATSRKTVPAAFRGKKRGLEEDEDDVDENAIEAKRRQNTLAARRSRQRKLQHVRELEELVDRLTTDREQWMKRAYEAEAKLRAHGMS